MTAGKKTICLLGDYSEQVLAHRAINRVFAQAEQSTEFAGKFQPHWLGTGEIAAGDGAVAEQFAAYDGVWIVPGSPYENTGGVLAVLTYLRTRHIPFLGTCGGYQHAIIEFSRQVLGITDADHAELNPEAETPVISALACRLVEKSERLQIANDSHINQLYGVDSSEESYHCSFGLNDAYRQHFANSAMAFVVCNNEGVPRAFELKNHPFFIGTAYQPERRAFAGELHPLVAGFLRAV